MLIETKEDSSRVLVERTSCSRSKRNRWTMSKSDQSTTGRNFSAPRRHHPSPLERVDQRTARWKPGKVRENDEYKRLCLRGECSEFQPPSSSYRYYFIHRETDIETLDDLIEYAHVTKEYTIDTESQTRPAPQQPDPALIQIEFIQHNHPSLIVLLETLHLPAQRSKQLEKIKELCQAIFSTGHVIHSWGSAKAELKRFFRFSLFDESNMNRIVERNLQDEFKSSFHETHSFSPYVKAKQNETYSLQMATFLSSNEWLNKRLTLADWGCGIDMTLRTYEERNEDDEREVRELMAAYAINDCLAVTKIVHEIRRWRPSTPPATNEQDEATLDDERLPLVELHPPRDEWSAFRERNDPLGTPSPRQEQNEFMEKNQVEGTTRERRHRWSEDRMVHVEYEPNDDRHGGEAMAFEQVLDDDERQRDSCETEKLPMVHAEYEPTRVSNTSPLNLEMAEKKRHDQKTRNQIANRRRRAKRYRYEVIRQVYRSFNITKVKRILKSMNITYVNINIVRHTLFIGLKNKQAIEETENLLHDRMFTEHHFHRLYPRKNEPEWPSKRSARFGHICVNVSSVLSRVSLPLDVPGFRTRLDSPCEK